MFPLTPKIIVTNVACETFLTIAWQSMQNFIYFLLHNFYIGLIFKVRALQQACNTGMLVTTGFHARKTENNAFISCYNILFHDHCM
jgi:hypothetical protein